jgi:hypothetical protein
LGLLVYAVAESLVTGVHWWRVFPLGLLERTIAVAEIVALVTLARWALLVGRVAAAAARVGSARPGGDRRGGAPLVQ